MIHSKKKTQQRTSQAKNKNMSEVIAIVVEAEIKPERVEEFLDIIEKDAIGSRAEPGCLRFDVVKDGMKDNVYFFYEVYENSDAVAFHKEQPHFKLWGDFKASGGIVSSVTKKCTGVFMT